MINWNRRTYTEEEFIEAWMNEPSICAVARKLDLCIYGSTYKTLKQTALSLGLPEVVRAGQGWSKGKKVGGRAKTPLIEYLQYGTTIQSFTLKQRLFEEQVFEKKCYMPGCGISEWMGKPVPLHLDHIDGDNLNNCLANLRVLCMNCHGQTDTYCRGKGKKKEKITNRAKNEVFKNKIIHLCIICDKELGNPSKYWHEECNLCVDCQEPCTATRCKRDAGIAREKTKIVWPETEHLIERLKETNYTQLAKELGVSDNAIRKRIRNHGQGAMSSNRR